MKYVNEGVHVITAKCENCFKYIEVSKNHCKSTKFGYQVDDLIKCQCGNYSSVIDCGFRIKPNNVNNNVVNNSNNDKLSTFKILMMFGAVILFGVFIITTFDNSKDKRNTSSNDMEYSYGSSSISDSSNNDSSTWTKTAGNTNGYDWETMNYSQKNDIVSGVIVSWENSGRKVDVNEEWFIDGLNSFYGTEATNSTNLAMAMSMIGTTGGVIN